jgi:hypothetical protein
MRRLLFLAVLSLAVLAVPTSAQDTTTVFVHGLRSEPAAWDEVIAWLSPQLAIAPVKADLDWQSPYESQAGELESELGPLVPGHSVVVGHSNGGVVSRQWARQRAFDGLVTIGSPNQGAPIVDHVFEWLAFLDDVLIRMGNVNNVFANDVNTDAWWWLPAQWSARFAFAADVWNTAGNGLFSLGYDYRLPVMPEMRVASAYISSLNSGSNNDSEAAAVPGRAAVVNVARDFYDGGPFRVLAPDDYADWHVALNATGIGLEGLAAVVRIMADVQDQGAFDLADQISSVAEWFLQFEEVWCRSVSDPSPLVLGGCYEHDGIVPAWSQAYDNPRLPLILSTDGPIHTRETRDLGPQLYQALTSIVHVPVRVVVPPPPPPEPAPTEPPPADPPPTDPPPSDPPPSDPPSDPPPSDPEPDPQPTGRYKVIEGTCSWDPYDSGPDQCSPSAPTGRYKLDGGGTCYWEPNDSGPDQCSPQPAPTGR